MKLNWKYLADTPFGKHWADKYINFDHICFEVNKPKPELGLPDPGLGYFRFLTKDGNLRNLLGKSMKIEKEDGTPVFVMVMFLSPSADSDISINKLFPKSGWQYGRVKGKGVPIPGKAYWIVQGWEASRCHVQKDRSQGRSSP